MVNFGLNSASILGICLAVAGAGLYFLRSVRPEVSRDYDIFFSAVGLLCGLILLFQGWRLDPILQFGQLLLAGSTVFFAVETIRLRGITTEQARRSTPYADDRRVSKTRVYTEAELDQLEPYEEEDSYRDKRRLRGYDDPRPSRSAAGADSEARPTRSRRPSNTTADRGRTPSPRSRRSSVREEEYDERWPAEAEDMWEEQPRRPRRPPPEADSGRSPTETRSSSASRSTPKRPKRPRSETPRANPNLYEDEPPAAYVDYQPLEETEQTDIPFNSPPRQTPQRSEEDDPET